MSHESLERIAAGLTERDCYVLLSSQGAKFGGQYIGGLYGRRLDLMARPWLESQNRWRGRMPAVYIDDLRIKTEAEVLAVLCHELGHFCDLGHDDSPETEHEKAFVDFQRNAHERTKNTPVLPVERCPLHSDRFVRGCLHLWWRAFQSGYWFPPELLWQDLYGLPSPLEVSRALGDEMDRLETLDIQTILILPAPKEFDAIFEDRT